MSEGDLRSLFICSDQVLMNIMRKQRRKLARMRGDRKGFHRPRPHRGNCVTSPAKRASRAVNVLRMAAKARYVRRECRYIGKRRLLIAARRHPVLCRECVARAAAGEFAFFVSTCAVRKNTPLCIRAWQEARREDRRRDREQNCPHAVLHCCWHASVAHTSSSRSVIPQLFPILLRSSTAFLPGSTSFSHVQT